MEARSCPSIVTLAFEGSLRTSGTPVEATPISSTYWAVCTPARDLQGNHARLGRPRRAPAARGCRADPHRERRDALSPRRRGPREAPSGRDCTTSSPSPPSPRWAARAAMPRCVGPRPAPRALPRHETSATTAPAALGRGRGAPWPRRPSRRSRSAGRSGNRGRSGGRGHDPGGPRVDGRQRLDRLGRGGDRCRRDVQLAHGSCGIGGPLDDRPGERFCGRGNWRRGAGRPARRPRSGVISTPSSAALGARPTGYAAAA